MHVQITIRQKKFRRFLHRSLVFSLCSCNLFSTLPYSSQILISVSTHETAKLYISYLSLWYRMETASKQ